MDSSGKITFDSLEKSIATFASDGWLGSVGGSNAINVVRYTSNLSYAVQNILERDGETSMMLSNLVGVTSSVQHQTTYMNAVLKQTNSTLASTDGQVQQMNALLNAAVGVINEIVDVLNLVVTNFSELVGILTQKSIYPGQTYSDFKLAMTLPAFHIDSILFSLQQFGGIQQVSDSGDLPNYLLTSDLRMQQDWLNDVLVPDYQRGVAAAASQQGGGGGGG